MKPDASHRKTEGRNSRRLLTPGRLGAGSVQRIVLLRALRARKGYALKKQRHKLCNQNGWCYWAGQLLLIEKLEAALAQENTELRHGGTTQQPNEL